MPLRLRFTEADLLRCRFAVSPLCETHEAVRTLLRPARHGFHRSWLPRTRPDLGPLPLVMPVRGYTPDFLGPPPTVHFGNTADFADEIARLRATDPGLARDEIALSFASTGADPTHPARTRLLDDPAAAVDALADATARAWQALVAPNWDRLGTVLAADIAHRSRQIASGGLAALFDELHRDIRWDDGVLAVHGGSADLTQDLEGRGLLLMPSVFAWPETISGFAAPWQPTVIYPAFGMARAWDPEPPPGSLTRLIGANRASVLASLDEPCSTTELAGRHGLAASTVSAHLGVLRDAGLVAGTRHGHEVRYGRTALGAALLRQ